jgi:site-specific DNA-adenine methylase
MPIERTGSPLHQPASPSEDPKMLLLHDLNDKLLKQVKALRSDKEDLAKKVAELEEQLNVVSNTSTCLFNQLRLQIYCH